MRRKDREMSTLFAKQVFTDCEYAMLATVDSMNKPYCIPISPIIAGDIIYFHCAKEGQKLENINMNANVCISGVSFSKPVAEKFTMEYKSAVAFGICSEVFEDEEKLQALKLITEKYAKDNMKAFEKQAEIDLSRTCVMKIQIETITGKANI